MDRNNVSHVFVLTNLHGLCELAKTELFKRKIARTTLTKTKDERYFFESVAIHDWNCDPKSNPNNAANADNVHEFMLILKQQEYYEYIRKKFNSDIGGSEVVEMLCSPDAHTWYENLKNEYQTEKELYARAKLEQMLTEKGL